MPTSLLNPQSWASHHGPFESIWAWSKSKPFNKGTKQLSGLAAQMTNCLWCMRCCCFYPSINKGFPLWTLLARPLYIFLASAFCFMLYTVKIRAMFFLTTCARTETFSNKTVDWTRIISPLNSEPSNLQYFQREQSTKPSLVMLWLDSSGIACMDEWRSPMSEQQVTRKIDHGSARLIKRVARLLLFSILLDGTQRAQGLCHLPCCPFKDSHSASSLLSSLCFQLPICCFYTTEDYTHPRTSKKSRLWNYKNTQKWT